MKLTENKKVTKFQSIELGIRCDICGKITYDPNDESFYNFNHNHSDWGNDSIDSFEYFDVCSGECYIEQLKRSVKELENYSTAIIDDKPILFVKNLIGEKES